MISLRARVKNHDFEREPEYSAGEGWRTEVQGKCVSSALFPSGTSPLGEVTHPPTSWLVIILHLEVPLEDVSLTPVQKLTKNTTAGRIFPLF